MTQALVLNPMVASQLSQLEADAVSERVLAIKEAVDRALTLRSEALLYVPAGLWSIDVGDGTPFQAWASKRARMPRLTAPLELLLRVCSHGPFYEALPDDGQGPVAGVSPSIEASPGPAQACILRTLLALHSDEEAEAWVLSPDPPSAHALSEPKYVGHRGGLDKALQNLRSEADANRALATTSLQTRDEVLDAVQVQTQHVRFERTLRKRLSRAALDVSLEKLYAALIALDACAEARLADEADYRAAYTTRSGIECSGESTTVRTKPSLKRQFAFRLPGLGQIHAFDHSKVGKSTRIHFYLQETPADSGRGIERTATVWVCRIDKHPKGAG